MKKFFIAPILFIASISFGQNVYKTTFPGCNTDHFSMESKVESAKIDQADLTKVVLDAIGTENMSKIEGILMIQVIVDKNGKSCLLSLDNKTNVPTDKLTIKEAIDAKLVWKVVPEKVSPLISFRFSAGKLKEIKRYGLHGDLGFHELKK